VIIFFSGAITIMQIASRRGWRFRQASAPREDSPLARFISRLREPQYLPRWSFAAVAAAIGLYACLILAETVPLSSDVKFLVVSLLVVSVTLLAILRFKPLNFVEKAALYVTIAVLVYLDSAVLPEHRLFSALKWAAIAVAAGGTVLRLRLSGDRRFVVTPLDLIVLFVALVVPNLSGSFALPDGGAGGIAKVVILFYALEGLLSRVDVRVLWLRVAVSILLLALTLRPLMPV